MVFSTTEYQHPLHTRWGTAALALFVDAAQAWRRVDGTTSPLHVDVGTGVRLKAFGSSAIRADIGYGLRDGRVRVSAGYDRALGDTMTRPTTARTAGLLAALTVVSAGALAQQKTALPPPPTPAPGAESAAVAEFRKHCEAYVSLHKKIEGGLPKLPQEASPEQIDQGAAGAQQGHHRRPDAAPSRATSSPPASPTTCGRPCSRCSRPPTASSSARRFSTRTRSAPRCASTARTPTAIPLSTMPPQILNALPKLPEELEYRFIGERLILFDHHAHIIVDYVDRALPRV